MHSFAHAPVQVCACQHWQHAALLNLHTRLSDLYWVLLPTNLHYDSKCVDLVPCILAATAYDYSHTNLYLWQTWTLMFHWTKRDSHSNSLFDMRIKVACNKLKYGGCYKRTKCTCSRSADEFLPRSLKCSLQPAALYRKGPHADFHATDCAHVCTDKSNIVSILICNCKRWLGFQVQQQLGLHWVSVPSRPIAIS